MVETRIIKGDIKMVFSLFSDLVYIVVVIIVVNEVHPILKFSSQVQPPYAILIITFTLKELLLRFVSKS